MNYLDFFKIPKAQTGIKTHSPNINVGISIPFDRRPTFNFNVGDNIDTQSFRNPRASHSSNFNIGGYYSLDTGNGSVFGNYGRSFNNFPSITVSGSVPFSTKQMAPAKLTVPDSLDVNRRNTMLEFLKSKGKDPSRLSSNDIRDLTMMFQDGSGDDVLRRYDQLSGMFNKGGEIHIKKKNVGSFTQYCNGHVTEECIERGKHSSNPTTRKRATFAANARTWKHQEGGKVFFNRAFAGSNIKDKLNEFVSTPQVKTIDDPTVETPYITDTSNDFSGYTLMDIDPAIAATTTSSGMRGMRNNNPGNIRISNNAWKGKKANNTDGDFEQFDSMAYGYRAMFKLIKTYYNKYGLTTPRQILQKYAPSADNNDPEQYAQIVSEALGITLDTQLNLNDENQMVGLAQAITMVENGGEKGLVDDILEGLRMSNED